MHGLLSVQASPGPNVAVARTSVLRLTKEQIKASCISSFGLRIGRYC